MQRDFFQDTLISGTAQCLQRKAFAVGMEERHEQLQGVEKPLVEFAQLILTWQYRTNLCHNSFVLTSFRNY